MQTNKWQAFLSDQELIEEYHQVLNGKYLFGKICHDALECLNNYLAILSLMVSNDVEISANLLQWFVSKKSAIETAVTEIYSLIEQHKELRGSSEEWPTMIKVLGSKLSEVQTFADDFQKVGGPAKDLVKMAIANMRGLQVIYKDILKENYRQLLTTRKYQKYDS